MIHSIRGVAVLVHLLKAVSVFTFAFACSDPGRMPAGDGTESDDATSGLGTAALVGADSLVRLSSVRMQETTEAVLVEPTVTVDPLGGFLVGDRRYGQVRRFASDGTLLWTFGRPGQGPGEFSSVSAVRRLPSGSVIAADRNGYLTIISAEGDSLLGEYRLPLRGVEQLEVANDSIVLISARSGPRYDSPYLYVWNRHSNDIERTFFEPFNQAASPQVALNAGWVRFDISRDTIAAIFSVSDSVYLYSLDGTLLRTISLPSESFRRAPQGTKYDGATGRAGIGRWLSSFDLVADVHWMNDGTLLVPYQQVIPDSTLTRVWHLLHFTPSGEPISEIRNLPALYTVDSRTGDLWLQDPGSLAPNAWIHAVLHEKE